MDRALRSYIARVLLLNLAFLMVVVVVVAVAGWSLYISAISDAESAGLERLSVPTNQTVDALERHFGGIFETMAIAERDPEAARRLAEATEGGGRLTDLLWSQLRGRLSALLVIDGTSLTVIDLRANPSGPTGILSPDDDAGDLSDPTALLISPALRSELRTAEQAQRVANAARPWLTRVSNVGDPAVSGVIVPGEGVREGVQAADQRRRGTGPVILIALPLEGSPSAEPSPDDPARSVLVGVIPVAYLEQQFLAAGGQPDRAGMLLFDQSGLLIAGGGAAVAGTPVHELAHEYMPPDLADFITRTMRGEGDVQRRFDGPLNIGQMSFTSTMPIARPVRSTARIEPVPGPAGADQDQPPEQPPSGARADSRDRLWLIALLNRNAVIAPLEQSTRIAVLWALTVVVAMTAILVTSAIQLIRGRNRLERLRTEMIDKELREARQIQLLWLPKDEVHETSTRQIQISAANIPASHISGDFYNYFDLPDGRCALVIGDVTGHGMAAAFLMATTQLLVRTSLQRLGDPGETLREVNNLLCSQAFHGQFVTIQLVVLGARDRRLQIASAGHPPPLTCNPDGRWEPLSTDAQLVLGVMADAEYPTQSISLEDCESLLLYTDGIIEAKNPLGERFSLEKFTAQLEQRIGADVASARELATASMAIVQEFAGDAAMEDDLTVLAVRLSPKAHSRRSQPLAGSAR